ncbi:expressed unknown protein [Seminavis robusta]|uniref:Uncharacterized protein n=1 Tax=Seminavis robusta TaxID=568900 RepID=A0A9N8DK74_9STRA|nr:expressed unknown protein [Seminavis robusta]|eukprot:Sro189_g081500.1 n/a (473) ;mRNA; f:43980-45463
MRQCRRKAKLVVALLLWSVVGQGAAFVTTPRVSKTIARPGDTLHFDLWKPSGLSSRRPSHLHETFSREEHSCGGATICRQLSFEISKQLPPRKKKRRQPEPLLQRLSFQYDCDILQLQQQQQQQQSHVPTEKQIGVILIHPIGVGIGKWFYNRLLESLDTIYHQQSKSNQTNTNLIVAAPDLLASGTAANPMMYAKDADCIPLTDVSDMPFLRVNDWAAQIGRLMANLERDYAIDEWCLVANGGCSPIALQVAQQSVQYQRDKLFQQQQQPQSTSSFESHFFQRPDEDITKQAKLDKIQKSYKTLCGLTGKLFWWYALRNDGAFIQTFSERNLVADAANLGDAWTRNCVATARMNQGTSRFSTFAFLAGSLQADGCRDSLLTLRNSGVLVDLIRGRDGRRNRAKSWFWQRKKSKTKSTIQRETLQQVLQRNGNRGNVIEVGGRISLAHEDGPGYAKALLEFLARPAVVETTR